MTFVDWDVEEVLAILLLVAFVFPFPQTMPNIGALSKWRWLSSFHGLDGTFNCVSSSNLLEMQTGLFPAQKDI